MPKTKKEKENEEIDDAAADDTGTGTAEDDSVENSDADDGPESQAPQKGKKEELFPKNLPPSEPPAPRKPKKTELDVLGAKIDEVSQKIEKVLNPVKPASKKREYQIFDEFDPTLVVHDE